MFQVSLKNPDDDSNIVSFKEVSLPLPEDSGNPHKFLQCIPEFIVENLVESIRTFKRFKTDAIFLYSEPFLHNFLSFIVVFMGSSERIYNPHLRAHLAECLENVVSDKSNISGSLMSGTRERLFTCHPLRSHTVTALIEVFVSIEMTGQSVQFEEKFNYRRPM